MDVNELKNWAGYQTNRRMVIDKLLEYITDQTKQIDILKTICIQERAESTVKGKAILEHHNLHWACWATRDMKDAEKQLAREFPEIFGENIGGKNVR